MERLLYRVLHYHLPVLFLAFLAIVLGIYSYTILPKDVYPESHFPRFQIIADTGYGSLKETELSLTLPMEQTLRTVPGVESVVSVTERGTSTVDLFMNWGADLTEAYQFVQAKMNEIRGQLPPDLYLQILRVSASSYPMSEYGIWSEKLSLRDLNTFVQYSVVPRLVGIEGIYSLSVVGGLETQVWIRLDSRKMAAYNLDPLSLEEAIQKASHYSFLGRVDDTSNSFLGFGGKQLRSLEDIRSIVVATRMGRSIRLGDIAQIEDSHAIPRRLVSISGHPGLIIDVRKQEKIDGIRLSQELDKRLASLVAESDAGLHTIKWDMSDFVRDSLQSVLISIGIGSLLIVLITYYFLNRLRYALPVIFMLPLIVIMEFFVLRLFGQTINIMTLGGLAAALGILSDNATVLTENYIRNQNLQKGVKGFVATSARILPPMFSATFVSLVIFLPLGLLGGVPGLFFKSLLFTLASSVILSLIATLFLTPILIRYFVGFKGVEEKNQDRKMVRTLTEFYVRTLESAIHHRKILLIFLGGFVVTTGALFQFIPGGFIPESDEGKIILDYVAPEGISLEKIDRRMHEVEKMILSVPEVDFLIRKSGTSLASPFKASNKGEVVIVLKNNRKKDVWKVIENLQESMKSSFPEIDVDFFQILPDRLGDLTGSRKPILINVTGQDQELLMTTARKIQGKLQKIKGLSGVLVDLPNPTKEIRIQAREGSANLLGLFDDDLSRYARIALYGEEVGIMPRGLQQIPITLTFDRDITTVEQLRKLPIFTPEGGLLPLERLAKIEIEEEYPETYHRNGTPVVSVSAEIGGGRSLSEVIIDIQKALKEMKNERVGIELLGDYKNQQQSFRELLMVLSLGILLIFGILLFLFKEYRTAIIVFLGTVTSMTFVVPGLLFTGTLFDVSSFTGLIAVMGIVANNGILVMKFAEENRENGMRVSEALLEAGRLRFRPVLITNLTTFAGFLPLALNFGGGGEVLRPFSIAILSGLTGSVFFSLIVMPILYSMFHREEK